MHLRLCYWRTLNRLDEVLGSLDLTARQYLFLKALEENGPCSSRAVCDLLSVTPADVTGLSTRLERKRFVHRVRSMEDRRRVILEVTDSGRKALEQARKKREKLVDSLIGSMSPGDFRITLKGLEKMLQVVSQEPVGAKATSKGALPGTPSAASSETERSLRSVPTPSAGSVRAGR